MDEYVGFTVPTRSEAWAGCLTLPREVFERDGRLCQRPVREVESLRRKCQPLSPVRLQGLQLLTENVQAAELLVTWHTVDSHAEHYGVRLETVCDFMWIIRPDDWYCGAIT